MSPSTTCSGAIGPPSLDFLCFLGHRATRLPVLVIAAWRRGEPRVGAGRLQALAAEPNTLFLSPARLSRDGVRHVLARQIGGGRNHIDDEVVDVIHARTGGQPFLVSELTAGMRLRNVPASAGCRDAIAAVTPESVRRNVVARLGRHSETVQRFAHAVAVLGDASIVQAAARATIEHHDARTAAEALVRAGILRDDATLAYAQPLLRAAAYDTLTSLECGELHHRAAVLLCAGGLGPEPVDLERVARHLLRTEPAGNKRFGEVLRDVAIRATGAGALRDARRFLARALGEIVDPALRGDVLARLAGLELRDGDIPAAAAHAAEALSLASTPVEHVAATLACSRQSPPPATGLRRLRCSRPPHYGLARPTPTLSSRCRPRQRCCVSAPTRRPGPRRS